MTARGFTLLELTVVLALVSLLTAVVGPRLWSWVESARYRSEIERVPMRLQALPAEAFFAGTSRRIESAADLQLVLPTGWFLRVEPALEYAPNGMSGGAVVTLYAGERELSAWRVLPPSGRVVPLEASP